MKGISSAVGFAAKLKPEIRLAQAISEFNASLSNKNQRTRFKNLKSQSPPTSDDIIRITEEINRDGARAHRSWRPCGTRLVVILERMRQFAPIGDVLVGGSQNLIACGVWAVVRLSLEDEYKKWLSSDKRSILWLKGNLGSGKTVAMASAAAHLILATPEMEPQGAVTVSYFFCQSNNPKTLSAATLLGSIVGQVLQNLVLESSFKSFLEKTEIERDICAKLEDYIDILLKSTPPNWRGILILDGLDEMLQEDVDDVFGQLKRLEGHRRIHLLCSSRPTSTCYSIAKSNLGVQWTLSMETADRSDEIRAYIATEISRWNDIRPLPAELQRLVEEQLVAGCQGMFLWLSLQIEDICPRYTQELRSDAEILDILGNLPKDLPEAFDKALLRMRDGKCGTKLFKLVTSAEPPLNLDELRVAFNVQPGNTRWDSSTLASSGKALVSAYGGSLLDIDEEDLRVRFIHYSVLLHLTAPSSDAKTSIFHFDLSEAEKVDLKVLIERGADINVRNKAGETPLMLAVSTNKVRSTKILLEHGADPNICDNLGARPLHFAQDSEIVQDLLHRGADPNVEAIGHLTPLMVAAYRGRAEIVSALLKRYADPEACLDADIITSKELLLLDWRGEATTRPEPGATALHLSAWRLERELKALSRCSHRAKHPDYYAAIRLCSGLVFIVMEILNLGIGYRAQYYEMLKRLSEALRVGANEVETLAAGLRGARKLVETTIRLSAQLSH
ncbi:hypothetical protein CEP53_009418 [Fusarium sp. AF-6]|nr:hypothetical protein CEP53_009418 [Fusarium sp. AF-6]